MTLNKGLIKAQADEGRGGDIHITSDKLIASPESLVTASSRLGIDGEVKIDSPEINLDEFMVVLPGGFVDATLKRCNVEELENASHFKMIPIRHKTVPFVK